MVKSSCYIPPLYQRLSIEIIRCFAHGCLRHMDDFAVARIKGFKKILVNHAIFFLTTSDSSIDREFYLISADKNYNNITI